MGITITVPQSFRHSGQLAQREAGTDPRSPSFDADWLDVDMRDCTFIRPAAVLWCVAYPLLAAAAGAQCRILVPGNIGVCVYLQSLGFFDLLKGAGIGVDDRGVPAQRGPQVVIPLVRFESESDVETLADEALAGLDKQGLASGNLRPVVTDIFAELGLNAIQHSESPIGAFGFIQFYRYENSHRFVCAGADGGIGIRQSLSHNAQLIRRVPYDWTAIEVALEERVTGTGEPTRGIGLFGVAEEMRGLGRELLIHSGQGLVRIGEEAGSGLRATRATLFPGTLAYASLPA